MSFNHAEQYICTTNNLSSMPPSSIAGGKSIRYQRSVAENSLILSVVLQSLTMNNGDWFTSYCVRKPRSLDRQDGTWSLTASRISQWQTSHYLAMLHTKIQYPIIATHVRPVRFMRSYIPLNTAVQPAAGYFAVSRHHCHRVEVAPQDLPWFHNYNGSELNIYRGGDVSFQAGRWKFTQERMSPWLQLQHLHGAFESDVTRTDDRQMEWVASTSYSY